MWKFSFFFCKQDKYLRKKEKKKKSLTLAFEKRSVLFLILPSKPTDFFFLSSCTQNSFEQNTNIIPVPTFSCLKKFRLHQLTQAFDTCFLGQLPPPWNMANLTSTPGCMQHYLEVCLCLPGLSFLFLPPPFFFLAWPVLQVISHFSSFTTVFSFFINFV